MSVGSFSAGLSGLNANAQALSVVGNNLANINTVGYKASAVTFQDLVYQNVGGGSENPAQIGLGVGIGQISSVFSQGTIDATRIATNVAIQGNGFFLLDGPDGQSYTRAGAFAFNAAGTLISPDGQEVQGYTALDPVTNEVITTGQPNAINVPPGVLRAPVASSQFRALTNLDADAANGSTFTTSIEVFDALGASHVTTMTYTKTAAGAWDYELTADGAEVQGGAPGVPFSLDTGTVTFDGTGTLTNVNGGAAANVTIATPGWSNGAAAGSLEWQILDSNGNSHLTSFATDSATSSVTRNGSAAGAVSGITITNDGTIVATTGAGQTLTLGRLALVSFNNPQGLIKLGSNRFSDSPAAGVRNIGVPSEGDRGSLIAGALEQSNVDMAQEFTQMILAQRGYQANGKLITVSDQLLLDTLNMKQ
jgi:flagellar hook protein FlgE